MKVDAAVKKETLYICASMVIMSAVMETVFIVLGKFGIGVVLSNLLIGITMILNFFVMGLTVQKAMSYGDEKKAKNLMKLSQSLRFLAIIAVVAVGALLSDIGIGGISGPFSFWALIPPLFFNRITMMIRGFALKKEGAPVPAEKTDESDGDEK